MGIYPGQPHIDSIVDGLFARAVAGQPHPHAVVLLGPTPEEIETFRAAVPAGVSWTWAPSRTEVDPDWLSRFAGILEPIWLEFLRPAPTPDPLALAFLDAVSKADLARALALAETSTPLALVDGSLVALAERLRSHTKSEVLRLVAAVRALWEIRYRLVTTDVPHRAALPALIAEVAHVLADLPPTLAPSSPAASLSTIQTILTEVT